MTQPTPNNPTGSLQRDVEIASRRRYDLIVVGGGVHGCALVREAARAGRKTLLIERDDFGGAVSWNSLRIVHGGLRYLQKMDLLRFRESVAERSWFLRAYPDLVEPLPCLMPLYGKGLKRPSIFRMALGVNAWLSRQRNAGIREDRHLLPGGVLDAEAVTQLMPLVPDDGLAGAGRWYDAIMPSCERVIMSMLRDATACDATALNHVQANELVHEQSHVKGIDAVDHVTGQTHRFHAPVVVNCAGPWCRELAARFDRDKADLMHPVLAYNIMFDRPPLGDHALAVSPPLQDGQVYFAAWWNRRLVIGTRYLAWPHDPSQTIPPDDEIATFIGQVNLALPGIDLSKDEILRVYGGVLPGKREGSDQYTDRTLIVDHQHLGGPQGLLSLSGIKFTTARAVAHRILKRLDVMPPSQDPDDRGAPMPEFTGPSLNEAMELHEQSAAEFAATVKHIVRDEAVVHLDDLILRRTVWGGIPQHAMQAGAWAAEAIDHWTPDRRSKELARLAARLQPNHTGGREVEQIGVTA